MDFGGYKGTGPRVRVRRRAELGRRLTRRLSMVAKVPAAILQRTNQPDPKPIEITAIGPDKTQLTVNINELLFYIYLYLYYQTCECFILYFIHYYFHIIHSSIYLFIYFVHIGTHNHLSHNENSFIFMSVYLSFKRLKDGGNVYLKLLSENIL